MKRGEYYVWNVHTQTLINTLTHVSIHMCVCVYWIWCACVARVWLPSTERDVENVDGFRFLPHGLRVVYVEIVVVETTNKVNQFMAHFYGNHNSDYSIFSIGATVCLCLDLDWECVRTHECSNGFLTGVSQKRSLCFARALALSLAFSPPILSLTVTDDKIRSTRDSLLYSEVFSLCWILRTYV